MSVKINWKGAALKAAARKAAMGGLEECMRGAIMPDADEHCPVDKGTMRSTSDTQRDDNAGEVVGGYGGPATPYAIRQHEDATLSHTVGEAKWLENAFNRHAKEAEGMVASRLRGVL